MTLGLSARMGLALTLLLAGACVAQPRDFRPHLVSPYLVVDTGQNRCYGGGGEIPFPKPGQPFYGQDAQHEGPQPAYRDNNNGTVIDLNTGLIWVRARGTKLTWDDAMRGATVCRVGGFNDWRVPTIKELYSLINFNGACRRTEADSTPYLDTRYFGFKYGEESHGERLIDCQDWSSTPYIDKTMGGNATVFGVNFADGRIKGYPKAIQRMDGAKVLKLYVRYVRGNPAYGKNDYLDNKDGTLTDRATGLMWAREDSKKALNWETALAWVQSKNAEKYLGYNDWRMPNAKELQSIVDYTRAPGVTHTPAIDPIFQTTPAGNDEYPYFWTSTTHLDGPPDRMGSDAVYIAFGRALGWMPVPPNSNNYQLMDVHGAGAQRSDPKIGQRASYPRGRGPQGDYVSINNLIRLVRDVPRPAAPGKAVGRD